MSWEQSLSWYLDIEKTGGAYPLLSGKTLVAGSLPQLIQGEKVNLQLFFRNLVTDEDQVRTSEFVEIGATDDIVVSGKPKGALKDGDLLFFADDFSADEDDDKEAFYTGILNLDTEEIEAFLSGDSDDIRIEVKVISGTGELKSKFQFDAKLYRRVYAGETDPVPAAPEYPVPEDLVTIAPATASFRFVDGEHLHLFNPDDSLWYPLRVATVDGAAVLGLGEGVAL